MTDLTKNGDQPHPKARLDTAESTSITAGILVGEAEKLRIRSAREALGAP